jgi:hypothetical protein
MAMASSAVRHTPCVVMRREQSRPRFPSIPRTCLAETPSQAMVQTTKGDEAVMVQQYDCHWRGSDRPSHQFVVVSPVCEE